MGGCTSGRVSVAARARKCSAGAGRVVLSCLGTGGWIITVDTLTQVREPMLLLAAGLAFTPANIAGHTLKLENLCASVCHYTIGYQSFTPATKQPSHDKIQCVYCAGGAAAHRWQGLAHRNRRNKGCVYHHCQVWHCGTLHSRKAFV
jgi:hypothetical protein